MSKDKEQVKDLKYYYDHEDEYERLTADKLKNEPTLELLEYVIEGIKDEQNTIVQEIKDDYKNPDYAQHVKTMIHTLESDFIGAISFGHSEEMISEFVDRLSPKFIDLEIGKLKADIDLAVTLLNLNKLNASNIANGVKVLDKINSDYIKALTRGQNKKMAKDFITRCPRGVFWIGRKTKNDRLEKEERLNA